MEEKLNDIDREKPRQSNGEWLMKTLKPAGCAFVLLLFVLMLAVCFTAGADPIKGYAPPQDTGYYAAHPDELAAELEENVLPRLDMGSKCMVSVSGNKVRVEIEHDSFVSTRSALLRYFDGELLELIDIK